jgi:putative membrane protein
MSWIIRFVVNVAVVFLFGALFNDSFQINNVGVAVIFVIVLTIINWTLVPIIKLFTLPFNILTLGILGVIINGLAVVLAGFILDTRITFLPALLLSLVLGIVNGAAARKNSSD